MPKKPSDDARNRNVPIRLTELAARLGELEKGIGNEVEEVAADVVPDLVRKELRKVFKKWCDDIEGG